MSFRRMVDMARTPAEKLESVMPATVSDIPDTPYGLCICLTEEELEKLEIDYSDCEVGDTIHVFAMAQVTSISKSDTGSGEKCRIELAIKQMAVEDESTEQPPEAAD